MFPAIASTAVVALLGWGEWLNRRWSHAHTASPTGDQVAVVVLGFRNPQPHINAVNRWRVRAALRSIDPQTTARLILSGGATGSATRSEARMMAEFAAETCGYDGPVVLDEDSRNTWENVANAIPSIEDADRIMLVSQPAHGLKARVFLRRQRPDLADRVARAADYRPGEWLLLKPALAAYGLWTLRGVRADLRTRDRSAG